MKQALAAIALLAIPALAEAQCGYTFVGRTDSAACAIRAVDSTLDCWGDNDLGADEPAGAFQYVAVGFVGACGVKTDGSLACWGWFGTDPYDVIADTPAGTDYVMVTPGFGHACALKDDDSVLCWGDVNSAGEQDVPPGAYSQIECEEQLCCGVKTDGSLACWGYDGGDVVTDTPAGTDFVAVAAGSFLACALRVDGSLACWGSDSGDLPPLDDGPYCSVGVGMEQIAMARRESGCLLHAAAADYVEEFDIFLDIPGSLPVATVPSWNTAICVLDTGGNVECWGADYGTDVIANAPLTSCETGVCEACTDAPPPPPTGGAGVVVQAGL